MKIKKLRVNRFVNMLVVYCGGRFRYDPIFPTQFDLLQGTAMHRKPSTGNRCLVLSHTSMVLVVLALHSIEGHQYVFI